jgi:hypothetical protein
VFIAGPYLNSVESIPLRLITSKIIMKRLNLLRDIMRRGDVMYHQQNSHENLIAAQLSITVTGSLLPCIKDLVTGLFSGPHQSSSYQHKFKCKDRVNPGLN